MIKFKHLQLRSEFEGDICVNDYHLNPKLQAIVFALAGFMEYFFGKHIVITEILRDQETQDRYYTGNAQYAEKSWKSVHQFGCGVDVRISDFTDDEVEECIAFLSGAFDYGDDKHDVVVIHDIGFGRHLHLQVKPGISHIHDNYPK